MEDDRERKRYHGKMRSDVIIPDVVQERAELTFEKSEQKRERGSLKCVPGKEDGKQCGQRLQRRYSHSVR